MSIKKMRSIVDRTSFKSGSSVSECSRVLLYDGLLNIFFILPFQVVASVSMRKTEINVKFKLYTFTSRLCSAA